LGEESRTRARRAPAREGEIPIGIRYVTIGIGGAGSEFGTSRSEFGGVRFACKIRYGIRERDPGREPGGAPRIRPRTFEARCTEFSEGDRERAGGGCTARISVRRPQLFEVERSRRIRVMTHLFPGIRPRTFEAVFFGAGSAAFARGSNAPRAAARTVGIVKSRT